VSEHPVWDYLQREAEGNSVYHREWKDIFAIRDNYALTEGIESELIFGTPTAGAKISIAIPAYRNLDGLDRALESAWGQKIESLGVEGLKAGVYDVVVVDDSGDEEYLQPVLQEWSERARQEAAAQSGRRTRPNLVWYRNRENLGANGNWNRAIQLATSQWVVLLHHDDELLPENLETLNRRRDEFDSLGLTAVSPQAALATDSSNRDQISLTSGFAKFIGGRGERVIQLTLTDALNSIFPNPVGLWIQRSRALATGGLDARWGILSDSVWFTNLARASQTGIFPLTLAVSHKSGGSASLSPQATRSILLSYYRRTFAIAEKVGFSVKRAQRAARRNFVFAKLALLSSAADGQNAVEAEVCAELQIPLRLLRQPWLTWFKVRKVLAWAKLRWR
jgi:glycosyltransferase involved in cell wall biosynthesis